MTARQKRNARYYARHKDVLKKNRKARYRRKCLGQKADGPETLKG